MRQPERLDLRQLTLVFHQRPHRLGVLKHVGDLAGRAAWIDRRCDPADEGEREVKERPFEPRPADDPEGVALADSPRQQPMREFVDRTLGLLPRDVLPAPRLGLGQVGGASPARRNGVAPKPDDRPLAACAHGFGLYGRDRGLFRELPASLYNWSSA